MKRKHGFQKSQLLAAAFAPMGVACFLPWKGSLFRKIWKVLESKCWRMTWNVHPGKEWCRTSRSIWRVWAAWVGGMKGLEEGRRRSERGGTEEDQFKAPGWRWEDWGDRQWGCSQQDGPGNCNPWKIRPDFRLWDCWDLNQTLKLAKAASGKQMKMGYICLGE